MRILYFDIDSLRPDHLGCYGYHRKTSPNIDTIAGQGVRFNNCYTSDAPCLPSRSALWSGRFGIHNGVINHGGTAGDPFIQGESRGFRTRLGQTNWMTLLRQAGHKTATISTFGERHSAFHWYAGFNEIFNLGKGGLETADEVEPLAIDWLKRNAKSENWFLHVNLWDPHTPYRTPESFGNPFKDEPTPAWLTEEVRQQHWRGGGPHSAQEVSGFGYEEWNIEYEKSWPMQPKLIDSMAKVRAMFDGYDRGTLYADAAIGHILNHLADQNLLDETTVVISADHGESLGEFNIYGDHQTADHTCSRIPLIVRSPGITKQRADDVLLYHFDFAATLVELAGGKVPNVWDGKPFTSAFKSNQSKGRENLVISQGAWSCQRSVRWSNYLCMRSYHDGYHAFPDVMLFDLAEDPHEQRDIAPTRPDLVGAAMTKLDAWHAEMMRTATTPQDPMWTVMREGGPLHTRGYLPKYLDRLRATSRQDFAKRLVDNHPSEAKSSA